MRHDLLDADIAMPAHPASKVKWNGKYHFGNEALVNYAELGSIVAAVIAAWSMTEANLGRTFATLIGAKQPVAMSMYTTVRSFEIQRDLLQAAVAEVLPKRYADLFSVALLIFNRVAQHRHRFAHWVWGASIDPALTALLLVEPKHFWNLAVTQIKYWNNRRQGGIESVGPVAFVAGQPKLSHQHILVYRLSDLQEVRAQVERAYRLAEALHQLVASKSPRRQAIYRWLSNEADIQLALTQARKNARKPTSPPPRGRQRKSDLPKH